MNDFYRKSSCSTATSVATALILVVVLAMAGSVLIDTLNGTPQVSAAAQYGANSNA